MIFDKYTKEQIIISEQYFGKKSEFDKLDSIFQDILITSENMNAVQLAKYVTNNKLHNKIEKIIKNEFNFKSVVISIQSGGGLINAYTLTFPSVFGTKEKINHGRLVKSENGIRFSKPTGIITIVLNTEVFKVDGITARDITALLLHEVGHNFYYEYGITNTMCTLINMGIQVLLSVISITPKQLINNINTIIINNEIMSTDFMKRIFSGITEITLNSKLCQNVIIPICTYIANGMNFIGIFANAITVPFRLFDILINQGSKVLQMAVNGKEYRAEQFSDNFATSFGYGKDLIHVMKLFNKTTGNIYVDEFIKYNEILTKSLDILLNINLLVGYTDCHPSEVSRMIDQITYVEENIKHIKDPNKKKQMLKDLENMKNEYTKFKKIIESDEYKDNILTNLFNKANIRNNGDPTYVNRNRFNNQRQNGQWKQLQ